ncbi:unnamed protein product [Cylicocyclus nassatus]|uniref:SCP domain-containing protein n=1 Tax=Cylicocyclus nassatus TaxID=53992 RepID=A0AA36GFM3_CYLNA|nr:unnamed protein product [Cylicocyclus nassatus]
MLFALLICLIAIQGANAATCKLPAALIEATTTAHNDLRAQVAKRALDKEIYGDLPGTKSLFKLEYDCTNEGFAQSTIGKDCKHSSIYMSVIGRGENFITYRAESKPGNKKLAEMLKWAVEDWSDTVESPLSSDIMYTDTSIEPFANMIYNKTMKFGCSYQFCETNGKVAIACVYEKKPQLNEPLYSADSTGKKGCTKNSPCNKVIKGAVCETADDTVGPLCQREPSTTTTAPTTTTEQPTTCKLPAALIEAATTAHNDLRAQVAKRALDKEIYGELPGTKSLFKLEYDCTNEGFAQSTIGKDCKHSSIYMSVIGRGENFITYRAESKPGNKKLAEMLKWAVEDWSDTVESPLSSDVMYTDTSIEPFANMIYNKTMKFGCSYQFCETNGKVAIACVYENKPQLNEPLYSADSTGKKGCTKNSPCNKVIKGAVCETAGDAVGPLCQREPSSKSFCILFENFILYKYLHFPFSHNNRSNNNNGTINYYLDLDTILLRPLTEAAISHQRRKSN